MQKPIQFIHRLLQPNLNNEMPLPQQILSVFGFALGSIQYAAVPRHTPPPFLAN
jgi:hypothetical protein